MMRQTSDEIEVTDVATTSLDCKRCTDGVINRSRLHPYAVIEICEYSGVERGAGIGLV